MNLRHSTLETLVKSHSTDFKDPTINSRDISRLYKYDKYTWKEISLDAALLLLASWSQFGSSFFFHETAFKSVNNPLEHFLYPHISTETASEIKNYLSGILQIFSFMDAICTAGTYANMRNCRREFIEGMRKGIAEYKINNIPFSSLAINNLFLFSTFMAGSLLPWVGIEVLDYNELMKKSFSSTMVAGLFISYIMTNTPYIFSGAKQLSDFFKLSAAHKKEILINVFLTKKGLVGFLPRALVNAINRSWSFYGISLLIENRVFKTSTPYVCYPFTALTTFSSGYQTLLSQGANDYKMTFDDTNVSRSEKLNDRRILQTPCQRRCLVGINILLGVLIASVFILRTLSIPNLYSGEIEDPANNYSTRDLVISLIGLVLGGYATFQYSRFRYSRWQDNFAAFFRSPYGSVVSSVTHSSSQDVDSRDTDEEWEPGPGNKPKVINPAPYLSGHGSPSLVDEYASYSEEGENEQANTNQLPTAALF